MMAQSFATRDPRDLPRVQPLESEPVEIQIMGTGTLEVLDASDISFEGIGIRVPHRFLGCELDQEVKLIITLPGVRPFWATGIVRHATGVGSEDRYGVEFTNIEPRHVVQIMRYVEARLREQA